MNIIDEQELIVKAQNKDIDAFSQLVKNHEREVRICLAARLDTAHEAEDLAQEAFIIAFSRIDEYEPVRPIKYWFRAIALNLLNNYRRKVKPLAVGDSNDLEDMLNSKIEANLQHDGENTVVSALQGCMGLLSDDLQKLVVQHYSEGYSVGDLTKMHDVKHSTLTMRLHRVRDKLRKCIDEKLAAQTA
ncbi:RNA polymerase sigma factor [Saccharobesus litoralis]|uniref:RNA polymerase sigma factor n=1 Tax=Saccharobesus litoralis TaxID=2172099 RepID=UPI00131F3242|nr:RNA polymerase sigma factor [Saccharobesus litoralis]